MTMQITCRVTVTVTDPDAVAERAIQDLREADIDWSAEEDDLETACAELRADPRNALSSLVDPDLMIAAIPGVEFRSSHVWAEPGDADPRLLPS